MTSPAPTLDAFARWLEAEGLLRRSVETYLYALAAAGVPSAKEPWKVLAGSRLTRSSKITYRAALRRWATFTDDAALLGALDLMNTRKLLSRRESKAKAIHRELVPAEVERVIGVCERHMAAGGQPGEPWPPWVAPALLIMIKVGLRASVDLLGLRRETLVSTIKAHAPEMTIWTKGARERAVPTSPIAAELLALARMPGWETLLDLASPRRRGSSRAGWTSVRRWLAVACEEAGVDPKVAHPHRFRHAAAQRLLALTGDVFIVRDLLGHASVRTTEQYLQARRVTEIGDLLRKSYGKPGGGGRKEEEKP